MTKWPCVKLGEIAKISSGGTPSKSVKSFWTGDIPWVSPKDMKNDTVETTVDFINSEAISNSAAKIAETHSILAVVRSGILAHSFPVAKISRPSSFNQDIKAITPDTSRLNYEYLFWALKAKEADVLNRGVKKGATVHSLSNGFLEALDIPLPPVEKQRRIVALLDRAAEIRRRAEAARDKARTIIPALFVDMFGDPATNPKGWCVVELGEVLDSAQYGTSQKANEAGRGVPVIRMGNVTISGDLDTSDLKYIALEGKEYENAELIEGDILFNRTNSKELVGKTGIWDGRFEAVAASYFIRLRVNREFVAPEYVWCFMNTPHMKKALFNTARGAIGQSNINAKELRAFALPLPDKQLQDSFAAELRSINALTARYANGAETAGAVQTALSAEVFA